MGISQLLPFMNKHKKCVQMSQFRGCTVAVDSYCWLHRGSRCCATALAKKEPTDGYVRYCMKYVQMLLSYEIKPIMVFDGRKLAAKRETNKKRQENRAANLKAGMEQLRLGNRSEANKFFSKCIDVTPEMALALIQECRKIFVDCIVAPYESDAQLAYLCKNNFADLAISEDSDLLVFGCERVIYKMDSNGMGELVEAKNIMRAMNMNPKYFTFDKFMHMCILSGCDYLASLQGIGLKKALKFVSLTLECDPNVFIERLPRYLNMRKLAVPENYKEDFLMALATFKHQTVFDPVERVLKPLNPITCPVEYCRNAGEMFDNGIAYQLALGNLDPTTLMVVDNYDPQKSNLNEYSIWSLKYRRRPSPELPEIFGEPEVPNAAPAELDPQPSCSSSRPVDARASTTERSQIEADIEKELEFYRTPSSSTTSSENDFEAMKRLEEEADTSPVLGGGNNPFMKKRLTKTSKEAEINDTVSRFFSNSSIDLDCPRIHNDSFQSEDTEGSSTPPEDSESDNVSVVASADVNISDSDDLLEYAYHLPLECILEEVESVPEPEPIPSTSKASSTLASVENLPKTGNRKRKLESNSNKPKKNLNQPTIQDMFKKMRMN